MPIYIQPESLDWALKHVELEGDTDIFPVPFEYEAIRFAWTSRLREHLSKQDLFNWTVRPYRRCLSPKHRFGFRVSTQLDPFDHLLFTALVYELGADLEATRLSTASDTAHSYRFNPDETGLMYDPAIGLESFRERTRELAADPDSDWVVLADIADFFPRIYSHPLDNAIRAATSKTDHAKALSKMLSSWNHSISYGIPVGPAASRLLAEAAIADIDAALVSEGYAFCRFVDDYRLFFKSQRAAFEGLAFLANSLFENHGLTLQQNKTRIVSRQEFDEINRQIDGAKEPDSLTQKIRELFRDFRASDANPYGEIDVDSLNEAQKAKLDALDLVAILRNHVEGELDTDRAVVGTILRRLAQVHDARAVDIVLNNIERLYPVFKSALLYLTRAASVSTEAKHRIGSQLLNLIDGSVVGHLEYHRCWIISVFGRDQEWNNGDRFIPLLHQYQDQFTKRELIAALGRAHQAHWFKTNKRNFDQFAPWERRAFIAAASCLPGDEAKFWYKSIAPRLDELERSVSDWAQQATW